MGEKVLKGTEGNFMTRLAGFIVNKRNLFFLLVVLGIVFSAFSIGWVEVENDLVYYLPDDSETKTGMEIMEEQFVTLGTAQVMVANITYQQAAELAEDIAAVEGVQSITFDNSGAHYQNASALFTVSFSYQQYDEQCEISLDKIKTLLSGHDVYIGSDIGYSLPDIIAREVSVIMIYVSVIILIVLLLTSQTYAEIPVLLLTFMVAAILNMGTNFMMGKISFVSNSVTTVLQLALSLDYAVILCNRYKEERKSLSNREAVVAALSKSIPEITASSLTTIGGLFAMVFMQFKIGPDMGVNLIKSIFFALLSVFVVMPGVLVWFGPLMDKTKHRNFIPKIPFVGKFAYASRHLIPTVFVVVLIAAWHFAGDCPYVYGYTKLETTKLNEKKIAEQMIEDNFTSMEMVALVVPAGDYEAEGAILRELSAYQEISSAMGLANVEALGGYVLSDRLSPREFAELADLDYELAQLIYAAYAAEQGDYGQAISSLAFYEVPLIDMFLYVCEQVDSGLVTLEAEQMQMLATAQVQMQAAKTQLQGADYSRMLIYLDIPEGGDRLYAFLDTMRETAEKYYGEGDVYVVGNPTSEYDFQKTFGRDNTVISVLTILIVLAVLLFTFKSVGMPILLIMVIQGSIWINFSIPSFTGDGVFFMTYLIVSAIQMGANIDYAIVIASRFMELKDKMPHKEAIIETMNFAFPTIVISGTIMASASAFIGQMTSEGSIANMGMNLARGTLISIVLVMFVLPQLLLIGAKVIEKTSFSVPKITLGILLAVGLAGQAVVPGTAAEATYDVTYVESDTIKIANVEDLLEFAENCTLDTWSQDKTVVLQNDIYLEGIAFYPIPTFGGVFDGKGHSIIGLDITESVSPAGLFAVLQEGAVVKNLNVVGNVAPSGYQANIGGIVGENYGQLTNCTFTGTVSGQTNTGGIAGMNGYTGVITNCRTSGTVLGEQMTGGLVGFHQGTIIKGKNDASVNTESMDTTLSLDDLDLELSGDVTKLSSIDLTQTASDIGGVAGYSTGIILESHNEGAVGYPHIGYNIGGIAGRSCGYIAHCTNEGMINGRKDVGGIVGQMEPYILIQLSESGIGRVKQETDALSAALETAERNLGSTSSSLKKRIQKIQTYTEEAEKALQKMTEEPQAGSVAEVKATINILTKQMELLTGEAASGVGTAGRDVQAVTDRIGSLEETFQSVMQEAEGLALTDFVEDISDYDLETATYGKVSDSENTGRIYGDMNVGGIAGALSVEYALDPEDDVTATLSMEERRKYELTAILHQCVNQAEVAAKKDYVGGICGYMDLGLVAECEGYGHIYSQSGDYVGGIAGITGSTVRNSFAKCSLSGRRYIGGIVGAGNTEDVTGESSLVSQCYSMVDITEYQQFAGAVAGVKSGTYMENYFVSEDLAGINRISYGEEAEPITYEALLEVDGLPEAFREFTLSFVAGDQVLYATTFEYGDSFEQDIFPMIPGQAGQQAFWDVTELKNLKKDTVVTAVYGQYLTTIASEKAGEHNRPVFLAEGRFTEGDLIEAKEEAKDFAPGEMQSFIERLSSAKVIEQWSIAIPDDGLLIHTLRYLAPEEGNGELDIYVKQEGTWKRAERERVGSYLLFYIAGTEAEIAVVATVQTWWCWVLGAAIIALVIGGGIWMVQKKKDILKWLVWVLAGVLLVAAVGLILVFTNSKLKSGVEAYQILKDYVEQPQQAFRAKVQATLGDSEFALEADVFCTEVEGHQVTKVEQSGMSLFYADGVIYLENGKVYKASRVSADYSELLWQTVLLYHDVDMDTVKEGDLVTYRVAVKEESTGKIIQYLLPSLAEEIQVQKLQAELLVEQDALSAIRFTAGANLKDKADSCEITATLDIADTGGAAEIPQEIRQAIVSGNPQVEDIMTADIFRLYAAWKELYAREPLGMEITLTADCGPLALQEDLTLITTVEEEKRISCIQKGDFSVYFTEDTICSENGYRVTTKKAEAVGTAELLGIAFGLCTTGTFSCTEVDDTYYYSLALDEEGMKEIASVIAPASADLGIRFENGSIQVRVRDEQIASIRFACDGSLDILVTEVAAALSAELDMTNSEKYQSFTVPEKVLKAVQ